MAAINGDAPNAINTDRTHSECPLLELPAELRNRIYHLCFLDTPKELDLLEARAKVPSKALVHTCQQIYHETKAMYRKSYRNFWSKTRFVLFLLGSEEVPLLQHYRNCINNLDEADLRHVAFVHMHMADVADGWLWVLRERIWTRWVFGDDSTSMQISLQEMWIPSESTEELHAANFDVLCVGGSAWLIIDMQTLSGARIAEAKRIVGQTALGRDELLLYLRDVPGAES